MAQQRRHYYYKTIHLLVVAVVSGKARTARGLGGEADGERGGVDGVAETGGRLTVEKERHTALVHVAPNKPVAPTKSQMGGKKHLKSTFDCSVHSLATRWQPRP